MKRFLLCVAAAVMVLGMAAASFGADAARPIVIDVRTQEEWDTGHLEGAILIPDDRIGEKIGTAVKDKSARIYLYCRSGRRAKLAKESLEKLGYSNVVNLGSLQNAARVMNLNVVVPQRRR